MDLYPRMAHVLLAGLTAAAVVTVAGCYTKPPSLGLPCVVDSECGAGEFCVGGECSANPGASEAGGETVSTSMSTVGTTTVETTDPTTTDTSTTSTSTSTSTTSTSSTSDATTGLICPPGMEEENGECVQTVCTEGVCGSVELGWHRVYDSVWAKAEEVKRVPQRVSGLVALPDGGLIVAGEMYGTMMVDGKSEGVADERALFLARYDSDGGLKWFNDFPCAHDFTVINDIDYRAASDRVVLIGTVDGAAPDEVALSLGPGGEIQTTNPDVFVAQFNGDGSFDWHKHFSGSGFQVGFAVSYSPSGSIVIGGEYEASFDGINPALPLAAPKSPNTFVFSLSSTGEIAWAQGFGDVSGNQGFGDLTTIQGNDIFVVGDYEGTMTFPPNTTLPVAEGGQALYMVRLDGDGSHKWSITADNGVDQLFTGLASSPNSSAVYATAYVAGKLDVEGFVYTSGIQSDILLMKVANNTVLWVQGFGDDKSQLPTSVAMNDGGERVILSGNCGGEVDFGGGLLTALGHSDACFAEFDADGAHRWSAFVGGDDPPPVWSLYESSGPAALRGNDDIYISQSYTNSADLFGTPLTVDEPDGRASVFARLLAQ